MSHMLQGRIASPARGLVAAALLATTVVGCSSGSSSSLSKKDPLGSIVTAMHDAKSGKISGTTNGGPNGSKTGPMSGVWQGGLSGQQDTHVTFVTAAGTELPAEIRVVNNKMYYSRAVANLPPGEPLGIFARAGKFKEWKTAILPGQIIALVPAAFSPAALAEHLQQLKVPVKTSSGGKVGSVSTTRVTTTRSLAIGAWLGATVDLWVDGQNRVIRVQISTPAGTGARYDVTGFGTSVNVTPPPQSAISEVSELPPREPAGPFAPVQSGTSNGVTWTLSRAPGTSGTECWKFDANPPLPQSGLKQPTDPRCVTPPAKDADPEDTVYFPVEGNGTGSYDGLAIVLPPGAKDLTLGFVGGKMQPLTAAPVVVWVGPSDPVKGYVGVTLADGTKLDCGAGAITTPADLNDPAVTQNVASAAWGCVQHQADS